ncbi:MAG TPA: DUF3147 family protein [Terracidiphilus sp.]|jgi:uncharacterized membrane protein (GlpM family)|nr:DUF3147 family protein [Terracidiphilus sp.]
MGELIIRFLVGGAVVSLFAVMAEVVRPKSFAGVFGAAPSIALATIGITIAHHGRLYASTEAHSMIFGVIAFFLYASASSWLLMHRKCAALTATSALLPIWFGASLALLYLVDKTR